jgi:uncharacterized protein (DUF433 family)
MPHERVVSDPSIMFGKPTIKGTRITVEQILRELASGATPDDVLREHPRLTLEDVRAAQAFAADYISDEEVLFG